MKLLNGIMASSRIQKHAMAKRNLMHYLAWRGGRIFGEVSKGSRREFFCLDPNTWVWHEEWTDEQGKYHAVTTRYDVRYNRILKSQGVNSYQALSPQEEKNFRRAAKLYLDDADAELRRLALA